MTLRRWTACIVSLVVLCHAQVFFGPLVFDDTHAVVHNSAIRSLANIPAFFVDPDLFSSSVGRMYRPLVLTTLAIDHAIGGGAPWAFKLGNLLQHLAVCVLLLPVARTVLGRAGLEPAAALCGAAICALVFGLHPLHVETLCLVSSRSELLCALGLLVALRGWLANPDPGGTVRRAAWLACGTAIACSAKETGVLVPLAVALTELLLPASGSHLAIFRVRSVAAFVPAVPVVATYLMLRKALFGVATMSVRAMQTGGDPWSGGTRDLSTQLEAMSLFLPKAVLLFFCPIPLSLDHTTFPEQGFASVHVLAGAAFVIGTLVVAACLWRRRPLVTLAAFGALLYAAPWILIPLNVPFAEHRMYVPVLFFALPVAACAARLVTACAARLDTACAARLVTAPPRLARFAVATLLVLLGARTASYERCWLSLESVWANAVRRNPQSFRGWCGLADAALERDDLWAACRYLEKSRSVYPRYGPAAQNLREVRVRLLDHAKTRTFADRTLELAESWVEERPRDPFARLLAARARMGHHKFSGDPLDIRWGVSWALSCLAMVEPKMLVYRTAAEVLREAKQYEEALALFDASAQRGLANDDFRTHQVDLLVEATQYEEARRLLPDLIAKRPMDPTLLGIRARLHAACDEVPPWRSVTAILQGLGYDTKSLPRPPSLRLVRVPKRTGRRRSPR